MLEYFGIVFKVGSNAKENWELLEYATEINPNWVWFHLEGVPSPYVIMESSVAVLLQKKRELKAFPPLSHFKHFGGNLCRQFSKYSGIHRLQIIWTEVNNVSRGRTTGEAVIGNNHRITFTLKKNN